MATPSLVWFRDDLRVGDNPALSAAIQRGCPVVALYVLDEESDEVRPLGGAAKWWLHGSLDSLAAALSDLDVQLVLRRGPAEAVVTGLVEELAAEAVFWNRRYGAERHIDERIKSQLREADIAATSFAGFLLNEPWDIQTGAGTAYSVYSPFWRATLDRISHHPIPEPLPVPERAGTRADAVDGDALADWGLLPTTPDWATEIAERWVPGEEAAHDRLAEFADGELQDYLRSRNHLDIDETSRLSSRLRWGELSPRQVWHAVSPATHRTEAARSFRSELGWRDFAWHSLYVRPDLHVNNWRPDFDRFPWPPLDEEALEAWKRGRTGVPLVDAGMRELWRTGTMHNRVRMVVASFLTKNLLIDWRIGEQWFWDTLVDADAASNPFNWQWVAGSGADAAPYFRVFNPELQRTKFDGNGGYVGRWAPDADSFGYPEPIVDLKESRRRALDAYQSIRG
ncbi:cryptochrome/photolyase family protein [Labedella endophytica]|uniref:Deoxyribodipyrimidine photo-lyase n=1 Tax=Labedella endophytica TaxID=1523160 RepID=A0A3S0X9X3_9MICO|nr:deoxyribodipyrimidine photo-lyase [Labedella endophytica]RUR03326.1 deoxyribodipyrimidine photo-lyase [Labedella endophytica]